VLEREVGSKITVLIDDKPVEVAVIADVDGRVMLKRLDTGETWPMGRERGFQTLRREFGT
jgi:hypothetical protein